MSTFLQGYSYPDPDENISAAVVDGSGLDAAEWQGQETSVLDLFADRLVTLTPRRRMLDYGSGEGRLVRHFGALFEHTTSFEPDPDRLATQRKMLAGSMPPFVIDVVASFDPATEESTYDAALCSHVLQHVGVRDAEAILDALSTVLRPGGLLLILTTMSSRRAGSHRFAVGRLDADGSLNEAPADMAEFEVAYRHNRKGELPIRFFSVGDLEDMLIRHGFETLFACGFHGPSGIAGPIAPGSRTHPAHLRRCRDVGVAAVRSGIRTPGG